METFSSVTMIGGGVIGLSCAWRLARTGVPVTLFEANEAFPMASSAALGVLTPLTPLGDALLHRLHRESLDLFEHFARDLEEDSHLSVGHSRCGSLRLILDPPELAARGQEAQAAETQGWQVDNLPALELLSPQQCRRLEPSAPETPHGALYNRVAGSIHVDAMLGALHRACLGSGVIIRQNCPVSAIEIRAGRVEGLRTPDGLSHCHKVVVCAGIWTGRLHPALEEFAPMHPVRGQSLVVETERPLLQHILHRGEVYLVPQQGNLMVLGSTTEPEAGFNSGTTLAGVHEVLRSSLVALPPLGCAAIRELRAGLRPKSVDERPYVGPVPEVEGLWVASGHYKTGFGWAPLTAEAITELVSGGSSRFDLEPLFPRRQARAR